ncbi:hypothetical protein D3C86_1521440 [compost metagenome]
MRKLVAAILDLGFQVRQMLVAVGVEVACGQRGVRLDVVAELHHLDIQAVLGRHLLHLLHDLRVRAARHANLDRLFLRQRARGNGQAQRHCSSSLQQITTLHFRFTPSFPKN